MKKILLITMLLLSFALISCSYNKEDQKEDDSSSAVHVGVEAKTDGFDTLEEMEDNADIIIKGVREDIADTVVKKEGKDLISAYSFSNIRISEIYKDGSETLKAGDRISVLENEAYDSETDTVYHVAGYNMMVQGNEYLLFLRRCESEGKTYYVASGVNFGTVSLSDDGRTREYDTDAGYPAMEYDAYAKIWSLAREKYGNA